MKKFKIYFIALIAFAGLYSCEEDSDALTGNKATGGLVDVNSKLVGYVVGNGNDFRYSATFSLLQGDDITKTIDVYKVFTNISNNTSNEILLKTLEVPTTLGKQTVTFDFTFNELISGLNVNGAPISANDALLNIGDAWTLKYVSKTTKGFSHINSATTKVAVGTRFAGKYKVIASTYWRINVDTGNWNDEERIIESVNATTYRYVGYAGLFANVTNTHYFTIDAADIVRTPIVYNGTPQLLNGFGVINCEDTPSDMTNACSVPGPQNVVVRDDINGKDRIYRSYGYLTTSGAVGSREFYEVLEKVVE